MGSQRKRMLKKNSSWRKSNLIRSSGLKRIKSIEKKKKACVRSSSRSRYEKTANLREIFVRKRHFIPSPHRDSCISERGKYLYPHQSETYRVLNEENCKENTSIKNVTNTKHIKKFTEGVITKVVIVVVVIAKVTRVETGVGTGIVSVVSIHEESVAYVVIVVYVVCVVNVVEVMDVENVNVSVK